MLDNKHDNMHATRNMRNNDEDRDNHGLEIIRVSCVMDREAVGDLQILLKKSREGSVEFESGGYLSACTQAYLLVSTKFSYHRPHATIIHAGYY